MRIAKVAGLEDDEPRRRRCRQHVAVQLNLTHDGQPMPYHPALLLDSRRVS
jgi:hypothetical protein